MIGAQRGVMVVMLALGACQGRPAAQHPVEPDDEHLPGPAAVGAAGGADDRMHGVGSGDAFDDAAAAHESFARACFDDYEQLRTTWAPHQARHRAAFMELQGLGNFYQRVAAATSLAETITRDATTAGLTGASWELAARGGVAYEVEVYLAGLYRARGVPRTPGEGHYPPIDDDTLAGDVYCDLATQLGTHRTRPLTWLYFAELLPGPRARQLERYLDGVEERRRQDLAPAPAPALRYSGADGSLAAVLGEGTAPEASAVIEASGVVTRLDATAGGVQLEVTNNLAALAAHDCAAGEDHPRCSAVAKASLVRFRVRFSDVPPALRRGDWIDFEATIESTSFQRARKGPPRKTTLAGAGIMIRMVARGGRNHSPDQYDVIASY